MPALENARHERFAQELAKGKTQLEAYTDAGYRPDDGAANRLSGNVRIQERVAEILEFAATRVEISVASVTENLARIAQKAEDLKEASGLAVARAAWMDAAKLNGLVVDKSETLAESVQRIISDKPQTEEEWASAHGADLGAAAGPAARLN
jgi:hypothetical protein